MKKHWPLAALGGAAFSLVALAQTPESTAPVQGGPESSGGLVRQSSGFDASLWQSRLTEANLADRLVNYEALVELARRDSGVRSALETWTRDADHELAWTATLALREAREPAAPGALNTFGRPSPMHGFGLGDASEELNRMEQRLNDMLQGLRGGGGFQGLHSPQVPPGASSQSQSFELEQGPDGVKITVQELVDGDEQVTTYEGESLEQLLDQHLELRERVSTDALDPLAGGALDQWFLGGPGAPHGQGLPGNPGPGLRRIPAPSAPGLPLAPGAFGQVRTDRLGVYVANPAAPNAPDARNAPDAIGAPDAKPGLAVREVVPGSLADVMRVQAGDVLLELDGITLHSAADIAQALAARGATDEVRLRIADSHGAQRTLSWTPPQ